MMAEKPLVVLTSAGGKQCQHIIPHLSSNPTLRLRLVVRSQESQHGLQGQYPSAEIVQADLADLNACHKTVDGATTVLHIGPSFHPRETEIGLNMIDAAKAIRTGEEY